MFITKSSFSLIFNHLTTSPPYPHSLYHLLSYLLRRFHQVCEIVRVAHTTCKGRREWGLHLDIVIADIVGTKHRSLAILTICHPNSHHLQGSAPPGSKRPKSTKGQYQLLQSYTISLQSHYRHRLYYRITRYRYNPRPGRYKVHRLPPSLVYTTPHTRPD